MPSGPAISRGTVLAKMAGADRRLTRISGSAAADTGAMLTNRFCRTRTRGHRSGL